MPIDQTSALAALRTVNDPELHRDLVSLGMIKDLTVTGTAVALQVELTTPACPLKDTISRDVEAALRRAGATAVSITWGAQVRSMPGAQGQLTPGVKNIILVGAGKGAKSSKQKKAEELIAAGAPLKVLSEAEFLELTGGIE